VVSARTGNDLEGYVCDQNESGVLLDVRDSSGEATTYDFLPWSSIERVGAGGRTGRFTVAFRGMQATARTPTCGVDGSSGRRSTKTGPPDYLARKMARVPMAVPTRATRDSRAQL
jgi:hypothetical protein